MIRLIIFIMASLMALGGTSMAEDQPTCQMDVNSLPIAVNSGPWSSGVSRLVGANLNISPPNFKDFVTKVTEHLAAKLAQENICLNSAESQERSLVQFNDLQLTLLSMERAMTQPNVKEIVKEINDATKRALKPLEVKSPGLCHISSPWIDIAIEREPVPSVRAIIRFSQRQLLADQAIMDGVSNVPPGIAMPLTPEEFNPYMDEYDLYARAEINPGHYKSKNSGYKLSDKPIEERVPPDLLWLFRRTSPSGLRPFDPSKTMIRAMDIGAEGYTKIVIGLIDQCFASGGESIHYSTILDVADIVPLEQYKIGLQIKKISLQFNELKY